MDVLTTGLANWLARTHTLVIVVAFLIIGAIPGLVLCFGVMFAGSIIGYPLPSLVGILVTLAPGIATSIPVVRAKRAGRI
jgi:hypothetical protein